MSRKAKGVYTIGTDIEDIPGWDVDELINKLSDALELANVKVEIGFSNQSSKFEIINLGSFPREEIYREIVKYIEEKVCTGAWDQEHEAFVREWVEG